MEFNEKYLQYGDIIKIIALSNAGVNNKTFIIDYVDSKLIILANLDMKFTLEIDEDGMFTDKSISNIILVSSPKIRGYCLQNKLEPKKWIDIEFDNGFITLTGLITNLEDDRIEIKLWSSTLKNNKEEIIYLDFGYKGIPPIYHIKQILLRKKPRNYIQEDEEKIVENIPNLVLDTDIEEHLPDNDDYHKELQNLNINLDDITFSNRIEKITQLIENDEKDQKYGIDAQTTDMVDELLSTIPNNLRDDAIFEKVHRIVERYKQLRNKFSIKDKNDAIECASLFGKNNKPLAKKLNESNDIKWIIPYISTKRKVYDDFSNITDNSVEILNFKPDLVEQFQMQEKYYDKKNLKYKYQDKLIDENKMMVPFINYDEDNILKPNQAISIDQEGLIFKSTVFNESLWKKSNNLLQRFTNTEEMMIKSLLMMPHTVAEFSKIKLPNINIMTRSSWNQNYLLLFQIFKRNDKIKKKTVDKFEEINFDYNALQNLCYNDRPRKRKLNNEQIESERSRRNNEKFNSKDFLKDTYDYILSTDNLEDEKRYQKFLYTVIPNTFDLIKKEELYEDLFLMKNYSFVEFVNNFLEPFLVYTKNIHYDEGYALIRYKLKSFIDKYVEKGRIHKRVNLDKIKNLKKKKITIDQNIIEQISNTVGNLNSSSETLLNFDVNLLSTIIFSKNRSLLVNPEFVDDVLINNTNDCDRRFLTKEYNSLSDLENDNEVDIYYDIKYDDSPYHIIKNMKNKHQDEDDGFLDKLENELVDKHFCSKLMVHEMARTLIHGRKIVHENEYALLKIKDSQTFYKRNDRKHWILDNTISNESFIDNNTLFCNIKPNCIKNNSVKTCDSINVHKNIYVEEFRSRLDSLDNRLDAEISIDMAKQINLAKQKKNLQTVKLYKQNYLSIEIGKHVISDVSLKSPHIELRDRILSHENFPEKQRYILTFVDEYTRFAIPSDNDDIEKIVENQYWLYCKETNTKLLPVFFYHLAEAFKKGHYDIELNKICAEFGKSENGTYYDVHSGYSIRKANFVDTEDVTHSVIEKDEEINATKIFNKYETDIDIIYYAICKNLGIKKKEDIFHDYVQKLSIEMIDLIENEESFNRKLALIRKKKPNYNLSYDVFKNQNIIFIITSVVFICIQTSTPPLKALKTYEECVKSFSGYPMTLASKDDSGLIYMACIVLKLKGSERPWNGIDNVSVAFFKDSLIKKLEVLLLRNDIKELYDIRNKFDSDKQNPQIESPIIDSIDKWLGVLPPIVSFTVKDKIKNITKEFHTEYIKNVEKGNKEQRIYRNVIQSKIIFYGYAIIEIINEIVKQKNIILKTSSNIPYLQNSCCNDAVGKHSSTLSYFINENKELLNYIENSRKCELVMSSLQESSIPPLFFHDIDTTLKRPDNFEKFLQFRDNMYEAFIFYLKLDKDIPIPLIFNKLSIQKPQYNPNIKLSDKIDILKGVKNISTKGLDDLLKIVFEKKIFQKSKQIDYKYNEDKIFNEFVTMKLENINDDTVQKNSIDEILLKMKNISRESLNDFNSNLKNINQDMKENILDVVSDSVSMSRSKLAVWNENLINMSKWKSWNIFNNVIDDNSKDSVITIIKFIKSIIFKISNTYPSMIINKITQPIEITNRWKLSSTHKKNLIDFQKKNIFYHLNKFNISDDKSLFDIDRNELLTIMSFMDKIPLSNESIFNGPVREQLFTYCWYSVFRIFITSCTQNINGTQREVGEEKNLVNRTVTFLSMFLELETNNKKNIDLSYLQINNDTFKFRQAEKKGITDMFKGLDSDNRKIMSEMRKVGIGRWQEGKIGLVKYDPLAYDRNGIENANNDTGNNDVDDNDDIDDDDIGVVDDDNNDNNLGDGYDDGDGDGNNDDDDDNNDTGS